MSWYAGWLSVAWACIVVALIATLSSRAWAGNNCQPVPQPASESVAEVGVVLGIAAVLSAGIVVANGRRDGPRVRRALVVAMTLAGWAVVLLLAFRHAPSCPSV